jgi:LysM repeat protein
MWTKLGVPVMLRAALNGAALLSPLLLVLALLPPARARAESEPLRTHVVYAGQRLGSIAKRYGVSVDELTRANNIRRNDPIRPGQRLVIPSPGARALDESPTRPREPETTTASARSHRVESGQRLESIARRYKVSVDALCNANGLERASVIRPGQSLAIPDPESRSAESALPRDANVRRYFRAPKHKGRVDVASYTQRFAGTVFDKKGRLLPAASAGLARVLGTSGERPDADQRLIRLLVQVSDRFGGRPLRIVSGYRRTSYFDDSKHKSSRAVDFSIPGVPNEVLRDYLRTFSNVGVGYYPNSSFVHLDVRGYAAYWVDYAGPGEAPRSSAIARRKSADQDESDHPHAAEPEDRSAPEAPKAPRAPSASERTVPAASLSRGAVPATGTSALSGLEREGFSATRTGGFGSTQSGLPAARPSLDPP